MAMHERLSADVLERIKHWGDVSCIWQGLKLVPAVFVPDAGAKLNKWGWDHVIEGVLVTTGAKALCAVCWGDPSFKNNSCSCFTTAEYSDKNVLHHVFCKMQLIHEDVWVSMQLIHADGWVSMSVHQLFHCLWIKRPIFKDSTMQLQSLERFRIFEIAPCTRTSVHLS